MPRRKDRFAALKLISKVSAPSPEDVVAQQNRIRVCFLKLLDGTADPADFDTVAMHVNTCKLRALEISDELAEILTQGQLANSKVRERYIKWNKFQVLPDERKAVVQALEACDAIVEASTPMQMEMAQKLMINGLLKARSK